MAEKEPTIGKFNPLPGGESINVLSGRRTQFVFSNDGTRVSVVHDAVRGYPWRYSRLFLNPELNGIEYYTFCTASLTIPQRFAQDGVIREANQKVETYLPNITNFAIQLEKRGLENLTQQFSRELTGILQSTKTTLRDFDIRSRNFSNNNDFIVVRTIESPFDRPSLHWTPSKDSKSSYWQVRQNCLEKRFNREITPDQAIRAINLSRYLGPKRIVGQDEVIKALDLFVTKRCFGHNPAGILETYLGFGNGEDILYVIDRRGKKAVKRYVEGKGWERPDKRFKYERWEMVKHWVVDKSVK